MVTIKRNAAAANRGKGAEKTISSILDSISTEDIGFCFNRQLDAHAAGGRFPAQPADFQAHRLVEKAPPSGLGYPKSRNFLIEAKEVAHDRLLPHKNFSSEAVARIYKRTLTGTEAIVLVLHTTSGLWRAVPFEFFRVRDKGSWDLSGFPFVDPDVALKQFFGYQP